MKGVRDLTTGYDSNQADNKAVSLNLLHELAFLFLCFFVVTEVCQPCDVLSYWYDSLRVVAQL